MTTPTKPDRERPERVIALRVSHRLARRLRDLARADDRRLSPWLRRQLSDLAMMKETADVR